VSIVNNDNIIEIHNLLKEIHDHRNARLGLDYESLQLDDGLMVITISSIPEAIQHNNGDPFIHGVAFHHSLLNTEGLNTTHFNNTTQLLNAVKEWHAREMSAE